MGADERTLWDLDQSDVAIIRLLQEKGRTSNAHIARVLGVSEPTVRKRIDQMVDDGLIKVVAVLNPHRSGYATDVLIGIRVEPGRLMEVGEALSQLDQVVYIGYTTGRYDILAEALFRDDEALFDFLREELPSLGGVISTETYHVLRTRKINYEWTLPGEFGPGRGLVDASRSTRASKESSEAPDHPSVRPSRRSGGRNATKASARKQGNR